MTKEMYEDRQFLISHVLPSRVLPKAGRHLRALLLILFVFMILAIFSFNLFLRGPRYTRPSKALVISYRIDTPSCRIPEFSPFDFTVVNLYERRTEPVCPGPQSFLKWTSYNVLEIDQHILNRHYGGLSASSIECFSREVYRNSTLAIPDQKAFLSSEQRLPLGEMLETEFMLVDCRHKGWSVLKEYVLVPVLKDEVEKRSQMIEAKQGAYPRTNVLVLGVDSVSYLNVHRHLRNTLAYLRRNLDPIELKGYVKVGDNSFPNQNPLINGMSDKEVFQLERDKFYDEVTDLMIWNEFAERGYRSLFMEESPYYGLYNYNLKGFHNPPSDYYLRPIVQAMDASNLRHYVGDQVYCHAGKIVSEVYLDYVNRFTSMMNQKQANFFAYVWLSEIPHNKFNSVGFLDWALHRHIERLHNDGVLNNTVLVFLSDHGMRFDKIRATFLGKYEDRMPFSFVMMPKGLCEQQPKLCENVKYNSARLTTHYDMHATFRDLLHLEANFKRVTKTEKGLSLFSKIPNTRTCSDAYIDTQWCTCIPDDEVQVDLQSKTATRLATALSDKIGTILDLRKCYELKIKRIMDIQPVQGPSKQHRYFWITAVFTPGDSIFEGTVTWFKNGSISVEDKMSRCNWYWGTSWCVRDHFLERYCYCKTWYSSLMHYTFGVPL